MSMILSKMVDQMVEINAGSPQLVHHLLKVYQLAKTIGELENLGTDEMECLELAAILHDIAIKSCLEKYGTCTGPQQEAEGPPLAAPILAALGVDEQISRRICYLIGHHHTYAEIDGLDYQILVEADFLVNFYEGNAAPEAIRAAVEAHFRTGTGKRYCRLMYGV